MLFTETNNSLEQMKIILELINQVQIKSTCTKKKKKKKKLDAWKKDIKNEMIEIREKIKVYCKSIEKTTDTRPNPDKSIFAEADSQRTIFHNALITDLDLLVRDIKFNFSSNDFTPVIKARGLNPAAFMSSDEIEKINFPSESLFLPQGVFNGAPLLNAKILKLPENRVKITIWAMAVYNSQKAIYQ